MSLTKSWKTIALLTICIFLFIEAIQPAIDPDLGWHLRYGQYFFETGHVLRDNIISFIWPHYQWVQASWGYDLIVYQLFIRLGFAGLAVASATLTLVTFVVATWPLKRLRPAELYFLSLIFLAMVTPMWAAGMRTPTLSTPFMALTLLLFETGQMLWLPLVFLVWANLHGGFVLGTILITIAWVVQGVINVWKKIPSPSWKRTGLVITLSWIIPLVNPWGWHLYEETFKHSSNVNLNIISEWLPLSLMVPESIVTGIIVILTATVTAIRNKMKALPDLAMLATATYLAYSANRFVIVLGVLMVILLARDLPPIIRSLPTKPWQRWLGIVAILAIVPWDMFVTHRYFQPPGLSAFTFNWTDYCKATLYCSEQITAIMQAHPPRGNGFHPYNYGGYLSWRVPQVKTFIDGRMVSWEENGKTPPVSEGDWVFMQNGPVAFVNFDRTYHFQWAIVPTESSVTDYLNDLVKNNFWQRLYSDVNYSYFVRIPAPH